MTGEPASQQRRSGSHGGWRIYARLYTGYLRLKAALRGQTHYRVLRELQREQWLPGEELASRAVARLNGLLEHATRHSPHYRALFSGKPPRLREIGDLARLPILDRETLQARYRDIACTGDPTLVQDSSGGSTGNPVIVFHDERYRAYAEALHLLFLSWVDVRRGDRTAVFWGADREFGEMSVRERFHVALKRTRTLNSFDVDDRSLDRFLHEIAKFDPAYVYGYASSLALAARRINDLGLETIRPRAVRSSAETLFDAQRREIERAFGCPVYDFYGSREINNLAAECPSHEGLHVMASGRVVEIVDDDGVPVSDGETGHLVVTDLTNHGFPMIRYRIGDLGARRPEPCPCGRGYPLLKRLAGRSTDILTVGGRYVHGEFFTHLFYHRSEIRQFQVVQESGDSLRIRVVATHPLDVDSLLAPIREKYGASVRVEFERVDRIEPLSSGKHRFTVNETFTP